MVPIYLLRHLLNHCKFLLPRVTGNITLVQEAITVHCLHQGCKRELVLTSLKSLPSNAVTNNSSWERWYKGSVEWRKGLSFAHTSECLTRLGQHRKTHWSFLVNKQLVSWLQNCASHISSLERMTWINQKLWTQDIAGVTTVSMT